MNRSRRFARTARAASASSVLFGAIHVVWVFAYYYWPAFGRATLGPGFELMFSRPGFRAYDIVVAALFVLAGILALAVVRPWGAGVPRGILLTGLWTAAALLGLRGAAGIVQDLLVLTGILPGTLTRWVVYDFWFLLCGILFGSLAWQTKRPRARAPMKKPAHPNDGGLNTLAP
jgi:hypothetical protein